MSLDPIPSVKTLPHSTRVTNPVKQVEFQNRRGRHVASPFLNVFDVGWMVTTLSIAMWVEVIQVGILQARVRLQMVARWAREERGWRREIRRGIQDLRLEPRWRERRLLKGVVLAELQIWKRLENQKMLGCQSTWAIAVQRIYEFWACSVAVKLYDKVTHPSWQDTLWARDLQVHYVHWWLASSPGRHLAGGYVYREWLPNAKQAGSGSPGWKTSDFVLHRNTDRGGNASPAESISALFREVFLIGNFNDWQNTTPLTSEGYGRWALFVKDKVPDIVRWGVENDTWKDCSEFAHFFVTSRGTRFWRFDPLSRCVMVKSFSHTGHSGHSAIKWPPIYKWVSIPLTLFPMMFHIFQCFPQAGAPPVINGW